MSYRGSSVPGAIFGCITVIRLALALLARNAASGGALEVLDHVGVVAKWGCQSTDVMLDAFCGFFMLKSS